MVLRTRGKNLYCVTSPPSIRSKHFMSDIKNVNQTRLSHGGYWFLPRVGVYVHPRIYLKLLNFVTHVAIMVFHVGNVQ